MEYLKEYLNIALCSLVICSVLDSLAFWPIMLASKVDPSKSFLAFLYNVIFCAYVSVICMVLRPLLTAVLFHKASADKISESGAINICLKKGGQGPCLHFEFPENTSDALIKSVCGQHVQMLGFLAKLSMDAKPATPTTTTDDNNNTEAIPGTTESATEAKQESAVVTPNEAEQEMILIDTPSTTPALSSPKIDMSMP